MVAKECLSLLPDNLYPALGHFWPRLQLNALKWVAGVGTNSGGLQSSLNTLAQSERTLANQLKTDIKSRTSSLKQVLTGQSGAEADRELDLSNAENKLSAGMTNSRNPRDFDRIEALRSTSYLKHP